MHTDMHTDAHHYMPDPTQQQFPVSVNAASDSILHASNHMHPQQS